jgi:hypothetical protein
MDVPAESQIRWILRQSAALLQLGAEPVRGLVLPTADFFPDRFDGSPKAIAALMARVQDHAGLSDLSVDVVVVTPEGETETASCSSGACGKGGKIQATLDRVARRDDGSYAVTVSSAEARHPTALTTGLARAVSFMFLTEADAYGAFPRADRAPLTDLAAVLLGFGVLVLNGSYIYAKGCGGVSVHSATTMPVDELALALAIFCALHEVSERSAARHLDHTAGEHFDESVAWARSNASVVRLLRSKPRTFEGDGYTLSPSRSWLARKLGIGTKKRAATPDDELAELERAALAAPKSERRIDPAKQKRLAELKALVDETLQR